jgi:hypothetical protein
MQTVTGIFSARLEAERSLERLHAMGISDDRINLLAPGASDADLRAVPTTEGEAPGTGAAIGAVVGVAHGLPVGLVVTSLVVPGLGPVIAAGIAAAAIFGAGGALVGGALENALTDGLPRDELFFYEEALRQGLSVIIVLADDESQAKTARQVLTASGAESLDAARDRWWIGLRPAEEIAYRAHGRELARDETAFRRGFETALSRAARGRSVEALVEATRTTDRALADDPAFRWGLERGQAYLDAQGGIARESLRKTA